MGKKIEGGRMAKLGCGDVEAGCDILEACINGTATYKEMGEIAGVGSARIQQLIRREQVSVVMGVNVGHRDGESQFDDERRERDMIRTWKRLGFKVGPRDTNFTWPGE